MRSLERMLLRLRGVNIDAIEREFQDMDQAKRERKRQRDEALSRAEMLAKMHDVQSRRGEE